MMQHRRRSIKEYDGGSRDKVGENLHSVLSQMGDVDGKTLRGVI
jgi:hypothetical protein